MLKITNSLQKIEVKTSIIFVYGDTGSGKTSMAFTAKKPLLLDFDNGAYRSGALRKDCVQINDWVDVSRIGAADVVNYDTIIIDTAGECINMLSNHVKNLKTSNTKNGTNELSMLGYGVMGGMFCEWLNTLRSFNKNLIFLAHGKEFTKKGSKNGETSVRPAVAGSSKDELYRVADMLGYMTTDDGGNRVVNFSRSPNFLSKDSAGMGCILVDDLAGSSFMSDMQDNVLLSLNTQSDHGLQLRVDLDEFYAKLSEITEQKDDASLTVMVEQLDRNHCNYQEKRQAINEKSKEIGVKWQIEKKCFIAVQTQKEDG